MKGVVSFEWYTGVFYYCGWYMYEGVRYPKYTRNSGVALRFINKGFAINMQKTLNGKVLREDVLMSIDEKIIRVE